MKPPPLIPGRRLSIDQRRSVWLVVEDLAKNGAVEPRDRNPELYPLSAYDVAAELGWAKIDPNATYLRYEITENGRRALADSC